MKYTFIAKDEEKVIDYQKSDDGKRIHDPITITINIEIDRTRYNSVLHRYKTHIASKICDLFKPRK